MADVISSNKTIAKNTLMLYIRMVFTMAVSLYTSRVILNALGVDDNGIYNVVGGVVGLFMFLNGALSGATARFLSIELGRGDEKMLKQTFSAAYAVHLAVGIIVVILLETVGLWLLGQKLVIPDDRMFAAKVVYQLSILSTFLEITQVPYSASIISHERMEAFAYMSVLEAVLKLAICYALVISPFDRLITYGVLVLIVQTLIRFIYRIYSIKHFQECRISLKVNKDIVKPILSFSGFDLVGNLSTIARDQGVSILQNLFFGPRINSAAGLGGTANGAVYALAGNVLTAIKPSIFKCYAIGDYKRMEGFMIDASKFAFAMMLILTTPFYFESEFIMKLWLKTPPEYTALFCALSLGWNLLVAIFLPLVYAIHASGNVKFMSIVNGSLWISILPLTYLAFKFGADPSAPYLIKYGILIFVVISNFYSTKKNIPAFDIMFFLKSTIVRAIPSLAITTAATYLVYHCFNGQSWVRFLSVCSTSTIVSCISIIYFVFDKQQRQGIIEVIKNKLNH